MGARSKVDQYDLAARLERLYVVDKKTFKEIAEILRAENYDISRESLRRAWKSASQAAEDYRQAYEESKAIIDAVRENPNTDTYEAITSLIASKLLDQVKDVESFDFEDPAQMMDSVSKIARTHVQISRFRHQFTDGFERAKTEFLSALNKELAAYPELRDSLIEIVTRMEAPKK